LLEEDFADGNGSMKTMMMMMMMMMMTKSTDHLCSVMT
jgi:hypothetical protein